MRKSLTKSLENISSWQAKSGMPVFYIQRKEIPIVDISIIFSAGSYYDANTFGISQLTNSLFNQGTQDMNADKLAVCLESLGAEIYLNSDKDMATLSLRSLTKNFDKALAIFSKVVSEPAFREESIDYLKQMVLSAITKQNSIPGFIVRNNLYLSMYKDHPYANPVLGTMESLERITQKEIKNFYQTYYVRKNALVVIVGDLSNRKARIASELLAQCLPEGEEAKKIQRIHNKLIASHLQKIPFPSQQSYILLGSIAVNYNNADFFPILLANALLGGGLGSRLFKKIRIEKALVYSIATLLNPLAGNGPWLMMTETQNKLVSSVLADSIQCIEDFIEEGPSHTELAFCKQKMIKNFPLTLASNSALLEQLVRIGFYNLPVNYLNQYQLKIKEVSSEQIKKVLHRYLHYKKLTIMTTIDDENKWNL